MTSDEPYTLLLDPINACDVARKGLGPTSVEISFGEQHSRKPHNEDYRIEESWNAALEINPRIFDGSKFRLQRLKWMEGGLVVTMELGLTGYKDYLGTNRLAEPQRLILEKDGQLEHSDRNVHLANALGCEAILVTCDRQVVMLRRSGAVATHGGLFNGPSGHPEPKNAAIEDISTCDPAEVADRVRRELFDSVVQEVCEETNVPRDSLSKPRLIGCMADATGKPDVLFFVRTSLNSDAVRAKYGEGAAEGWESDRLVFWPVDTIAKCTLPMTAVTRATIACFLTLLPEILTLEADG